MPLVRNLFFLLGGIVLFSACDDRGRSQAPGTPNHPRIPQTPRYSLYRRPLTTGIVPAPGLQNVELFPLLADSYARIDPAKDGWETEAFSEAANRQLQRLVTLFEDAASEIPEGLASARFASATLRPTEQSIVFDDGSLQVTRATIGGSTPVHKGVIVGDVTYVNEGAPDGSTPGGAGRFSIDGDGRIDVESFHMIDDLRDFREGDYTLACWLKIEPGFLDGQHVIWGQQSQGVHNGIRNGGFLHTAHWGNDFNAGTILDEDTWLHAVWTYDGSEDLAKHLPERRERSRRPEPEGTEREWIPSRRKQKWRRCRSRVRG